MEDFKAARKEGRSEAERLAHQPSLAKIRKRYGEMAERLIAMLLTFDSHFAFRRVMRKRIDSTDPAARAEHCLAFARSHRTWFEQFERVSHSQHRSVYPHRTQFTGPQQIYEVGDLWCFALGALESHHAEVRSAFYLLLLTYTPSMITVMLLFVVNAKAAASRFCIARDSVANCWLQKYSTTIARMRGGLYFYYLPSYLLLTTSMLYIVCLGGPRS